MTVATSGRRLPEQLAADQFSGLRQRLRRSAGQVLGIERMLEADRDCGDVLVQLAAAPGARRGADRQVFSHDVAAPGAALGAGITDRGEAVADLTRLVGLLTGAAAPTRAAGGRQRPAHPPAGVNPSMAVGTTEPNLSGHDND